MYSYIAEYWGTENGQPPPDIPVCGLKNENCPKDDSGKQHFLERASLLVKFKIILIHNQNQSKIGLFDASH